MTKEEYLAQMRSDQNVILEYLKLIKDEANRLNNDIESSKYYQNTNKQEELANNIEQMLVQINIMEKIIEGDK